MNTTGKIIRKLRMGRGLSQEELAFQLGVARQTVSNWENDIKMPTTENIVVLIDFFNVSADYFLCSKNNNEINVTEKNLNKTNDEVFATDDELKATNYSNVISKENKNKLFCKKALHISLIILSFTIFVICAIIGSIIIFYLATPEKGSLTVSGDSFNWVGIVFCCVAIIAFITFVVLLVKIIQKKIKNQSAKDKMLSEDGRQTDDEGL